MEAPKRFQLQWDKLKAAVAYLTERSGNDDSFGSTKLVKLLYYADCAAYLHTGQPITGSNYIHMDHGPYPEDWRSLVGQLEREEIVRVDVEDISGSYQRRRPLLRQKATTSALTDQECSILDEQLRRFAEFNARDIEEYSHDELGWRRTVQGETIPYRLSGIRRPGTPDDETKARGRRIAKRIREEGRRVSRTIVVRDETV